MRKRTTDGPEPAIAVASCALMYASKRGVRCSRWGSGARDGGPMLAARMRLSPTAETISKEPTTRG